jgi:secreted trypsin-like serine protease
MKRLFVSCFFVLCSSSFAYASFPIFGGVPVDSTDPIASTTVLITGHQYIGGILCSGSLIADDIAVTAAHCVVHVPTDTMRVIFAQDVKFSTLMNNPEIPDSDPRVHQVYGAIANPAFKAPGDDRNDIAIIRFKGALNVGYHPAQIIDPSVTLGSGEDVIISGYGSQTPDTESSGGQLRKAQVTIDQMLNDREIVVNQSHGQGICWGDSGGPAFVQSGSQLLLWGVADRVRPEEESVCNHAAVFTRITSFSDFILKAEATLRGQH